MITGVSKTVMLYLAPVLALTSLLLSLFVFLAPVVMLQSVSLMSVVPSKALTNPGNSDSVNGATVILGALGSCSRPNNESPLNCTTATITPDYDFSVLPGNAPQGVLRNPATSSPAFIAISLVLTAIFVISFTMQTFRDKFGAKLSAILDKPSVVRSSAWVGTLGFMLGLTDFLVIRLWFGKATDEFNLSVSLNGQQGPDLVATIDNGFTMVWVAYAFLAVPLVCSLAKLHVLATKK